VLAQLEGFEAPAGAWETEIMPSRITDYDPEWLDDQCRSGRFAWMRLGSRSGDRERGAAPIRSTPIVLLGRRNVRAWSAWTEAADHEQLTAKGATVAEFLRDHGASFFDEIADSAGLLPVEVEGALAELAAVGLVNSDSFGGLRALLLPSGRRGKSAHGDRRRRRLALFGMADAGRWTLVRRPAAASHRPDEAAVEQVVRTLLRRWGVIFWKLLAREADWLPPWRDMLQCLRRLEARGELRGGRFVAGFSGEQYATPEAVGLLREVRRKPYAQQQLSVSAADPLNLIGILTPGARLASLTGNRLLYCDGLPIATYAAGKVQYLERLEPKEQWEAQTMLLRRHVPAALADLA
jgi:ATP-dependent Lhr-like helicase